MIIRSAILLAVSATLLLLVVRRMRRQKLKERHALMFIFIAIPFLILAVWPVAIDLVSDLLGISTYTVMLLGVSVFLILLIFELLTIVSVLDRKVSTLAQMVGILNEKRLAPEDSREIDRSERQLDRHNNQLEIKIQVPQAWQPDLKDSVRSKGDRVEESAASSTAS